MRRISRTLAVAGAVALAVPVAGIAYAQIASSEVAFPRGSSSTSVAGVIVGSQTRDYVVRARAGQTMKVTLSGAPIVYFNVLPPGSQGEAIFIGSTAGNAFSGTLSATGPYRIRVYQMRASARRNERGAFRLAISVTGGGGGGGSAAAGGSGLRGVSGMDSIAAFDVMTNRGFRNVDSFSSGNTQYGIFFNRGTRVCAQLTMADGKVLDARDIRTHPKCR